MIERQTLDITAAVGGWPHPWPNVAEIADVLPTDRWTLVGGLMVQLHAIHRGLSSVRPTHDVDIVLHVETTRGIAVQAARALRSIGYDLRPTVDPRENTAHRFHRGVDRVALVTDDTRAGSDDVVDVLLSDHHAPAVSEKLEGRQMVRVEGGTQALRRTVDARLKIDPGTTTTISVPDSFGALVLKAAAYLTTLATRIVT